MKLTVLHALVISLGVGSVIPSLSAGEPTAQHFEQHIRPVLVETCITCHGETKQEGGLRLDSYQAMLQGGESGPAIVPGAEDESLLMSAIRYESFEMPPEEPLAERQVDAFAAWIQSGAKWPEAEGPLRQAQREITEDDRNWWAFQPLSNASPPQSQHGDDSNSAIDAFVRQRLHENHMRPAPEADPPTLVRRLFQDVIGVPPTPEEVDQFVHDDSEDAYEQVVDRLLADRRYGEHWARFWLDLVRYAESDGWKADAFRPTAWRYRDYVIEAFNDDIAFPQFVLEQLAGDELESPTPQSLAATGFLRLGIFEYNQRNARGHWNDILNEITDVTGDVFLGMGMACARCHDHKYDPILQTDYFKLRAFFEPLVFRDDVVYASKAEQEQHANKKREWELAADDVLQQLHDLEEPYNQRKLDKTVAKFPLDIQASYFKSAEARDSFDEQMHYLIKRQFREEGASPISSIKGDAKKERESLLEQLKAFDDIKPQKLPSLMSAANHHGSFAPTKVPDTEETVSPGFLRVLSADASSEFPNCGRKPRTALAEWITSPENPLTVRVLVNRIWKQHFGKGLVQSVSDFGTLGGRPSHPELLDWLAKDFITHGWQLKRLHKQILMSQTWRQSATHEYAEDYATLDPQNHLLWRHDIRRLSAEQIRDAMLWASGELTDELGGPSIDGKSPRRSIYVKSIRNTPNRFLAAFDVANGLKSVGKRDSTTTPTQALMMINGDFVLQRANKMAARLANNMVEDQARATAAIRWTWNRFPSEEEQRQAVEFLRADSTEAREHRLVDLCHLLLNSNEFLYVD